MLVVCLVNHLERFVRESFCLTCLFCVFFRQLENFMISIAVFVSDEDYAAGLEKYLSFGASGIISFGVYTESEAFKDFMNDCNPSVVVAEESFWTEGIAVPCITLVHGRRSTGRNTVGMYQSLEVVASEIVDGVKALFGKGLGDEEQDSSIPLSREHEPEESDIKDSTAGCVGESFGMIYRCVTSQIISVCSPIGGTYVSTFASALASYHSKGARTLFVSFDPFYNLRIDSPLEVKGGLGKLIYLLDRGCESVIDRCAQRVGGLDCICGGDHWTDICDISREHAEKLIALISSESYKNVIFDIKLFGAASVPLLRSSDRIIVPDCRGERSESIINDWERQLVSVGVDNRKVTRVVIPFDGMVSKNCEFGMLLKGRLGRFIEETEGRHYVR